MSDAAARVDYRSLLARANASLEKMHARLAALHEPAAIVGVGCRFPGGVEDPQGFWQLLQAGRDAVTEMPQDRWERDGWAAVDASADVLSTIRHGGFVPRVDELDARFFGISPREAVSLDPQQRLLLEVSWEALEHAGMNGDRLAGSPTGVFVGITAHEYVRRVEAAQPALLDAQYVTGTSLNAAAGRLSYFLGLRGPSLAVDTACSSSLVALHLASQSLRLGECSLALAAGVNLLLAPELSVALARARALSPDGRCKTFDAQADGYVRGEGCGVLVLQRLGDALRQGSRILAVVRGTAVNQDGRSSGLTVPNGPAQQALIRTALANAGVKPEEVSYVEAHGTGTALGDPIELHALTAVLCPRGGRRRALAVGAAKTNIGHLESASGIAGVIKVVLALQHRTIPPHLHLQHPNPRIAWDPDAVGVPAAPLPWEPLDGRRLAGVSSFGVSGTNAHVILEEAPPAAAIAPGDDRGTELLTVSAATAGALRQCAARLAAHLAAEPAPRLRDVCFSSSVGRAQLPARLAVVGASPAELRQTLERFAGGEAPSAACSGEIDEAGAPRVAFAFTGQGSQYVGMGRRLWAEQPVFRRVLERCDQLLRPHLELPLLRVLFPEAGAPSPLDQPVYAQPALFALEVALAELWRSWGVEPEAVIGHSVGELAAACVAGVFSLEDGLGLVAQRGLLVQSLPTGGEMAAVFAGAEELDGLMSSDVSIAALNGPGETVIAGRTEAVREVLATLRRRGVRGRPLDVSHAYHSPLMEPVLDALEAAAGAVRYAAPRLRLVSCLTGGAVDAAPAVHWRRHLREPVRFAAALQGLAGCKLVVEVGPQPALASLARRLPASKQTWLPSLRRGQDDWRPLQVTLARLFAAGVKVDWARVYEGYPCRRVELPTYPFERQRFWVASPASRLAPRSGRVAPNPLVGGPLPASGGEIRFESKLGAHSPPLLGDHRLYGEVVVPGAFHVAAVAAAAAASGRAACALEAVEFPAALAIFGESEIPVRVGFSSPVGGTSRFAVRSLSPEGERSAEGDGTVHAVGRLRPPPGEPPEDLLDARAIAEIQAGAGPAGSGDDLYQRLWSGGYHLGPSFRWIRRIWRRDGESLCEMAAPAAAREHPFDIHPGLLDSCFQAALAALPEGVLDAALAGSGIFVPVSLERFQLWGQPGETAWCHVGLREGRGAGRDTFAADLILTGEDGWPLAAVSGLRLRQAPRGQLLHAAPGLPAGWVCGIDWQPRGPLRSPAPVGAGTAAAAAAASDGRPWLIFADRHGLGERLAALLASRGETCVVADAGESFAALAPDRFRLRPGRREDLRRLLAGPAGGGKPWWAMVHLWSLDVAAWQQTTAASLTSDLDLGCGSVVQLTQELAAAAAPAAARLFLVTRGALALGSGSSPAEIGQAALWGLGRVIAQEHPELRCVRLDLEPGAREQGVSDREAAALLAELVEPGGDDELAWREGGRFVPRLVSVARPPSERTRAAVEPPRGLAAGPRGLIDDLALRPRPRRSPGPGEVELEVLAAGLSFRDVLVALGVYPGVGGELGLECAGRVVGIGPGVEGFAAGDEVMAFGQGSFADYVTLGAQRVRPIPETLAAEQAAAVPAAFLTGLYALTHLARITAGERVLIHAAAGGVGMAAVQIARRAGARILATASPGKWEVLRSLGIDQAMSSRSPADLAAEVMARTGGEGVDVVLNSLNGDFIPASLAVLRPGGRFVELGRIGTWDAERVARRRADVSYHVFNLLEVADREPELIRGLLEQLRRDLASGALTALPTRVFPAAEAAAAFRHMAAAKHTGKIVLSWRRSSSRQDSSRDLLSPQATYLITGGLGALGLLVAAWMAQRGARHLVLAGRRGAATAAARESVSSLERQGVHVEVARADVSRPEELTRAWDEIAGRLPPLRGVVHAAGIVDDALVARLDRRRLAAVMAPKVLGAWNLHQLSRGHDLDFLVLFSSSAALLGTAGQGAYAAANAFLDALAHHRRALGLPAVSINWGPWAGAGMAAKLGEVHRHRLRRQGFTAIDPAQGMEALRQAIAGGTAQVAVLPIVWPVFLRPGSGAPPPPALLAGMAAADLPAARAEAAGGLRSKLATAPPSLRLEAARLYVAEQAARVLALSSPESLRGRQPLQEQGLDSLMAVELRNALAEGAGQSLPATLIFDHPSVEALAEHLVDLAAPGERLEMPPAPGPGRAGAPAPADLAQLSAAEIAGRLAAKLAAVKAKGQG
jgi:acyl transferase domain-containing protein